MNKIALAFIRGFFVITSRVSPTLAGRVAFRLFCTTFRGGKKSQQHKNIIETAQALFVNASTHHINFEHGTVAAYEFNPVSDKPTKTIWLVHGWDSSALMMHKFIEPLLAQGVRVVAIDLPGHGLSSGRTFNLPKAISAMHAVRENLGGFDYLLSHSLGGAVVATMLAGTLSNYPALNAEKVVMISTPNSMSKIFDDPAALFGLTDKAKAAMHAQVKELTGKETDEFSVAPQMQNVSTQLLLIHAPEDKEVAFSAAEAIASSSPQAQLKPMPGLGHRRIIGSDDVVQVAVDFITQ